MGIGGKSFTTQLYYYSSLKWAIYCDIVPNSRGSCPSRFNVLVIKH
jgi:hypothetical protein